jgi:hypothetical protein
LPYPFWFGQTQVDGSDHEEDHKHILLKKTVSSASFSAFVFS